MLCSCLTAQLSYVPEQNTNMQEIWRLQRMPDRTSLMTLLRGLELLGKSPISVTDVIIQAYKAELFSSMLFVLFLSSWKLHTEHFTLTFSCATSISLMHTLPLPQLSLLRTCRQQYWWYWKLSTGKESGIQKWMNFWMERSLSRRGVNLLDYRI